MEKKKKSSSENLEDFQKKKDESCALDEKKPIPEKEPEIKLQGGNAGCDTDKPKT